MRIEKRVNKILRKAGVREMLGSPENIDGHEVYILWDGPGSQAADEYTIIIDGAVFGMGTYPRSPSGFSQFSGLYIDAERAMEDVGDVPIDPGYEAQVRGMVISPDFIAGQQQVKFADLSEAVQQGIRDRF